MKKLFYPKASVTDIFNHAIQKLAVNTAKSIRYKRHVISNSHIIFKGIYR